VVSSATESPVDRCGSFLVDHKREYIDRLHPSLVASKPDEVGLRSIGVQGLFAVGATSTFTDAGRQWMESQLSRVGVAEDSRPAIKLWAALILFMIVFSAWKFLPTYLANLAYHYNTVAFRQRYTQPDVARDTCSKAISLNPKLPEAHYNLGALYENASEYDEAAAEYWGVRSPWKCNTRRRSCDRTTKTSNTRKVAVGIVKESIEAICPT
jgi:hypothetical protein